jgi:hypothetical protein
VDDLGDGRFLIRSGYEDPDAGPRRSRGEVSPFEDTHSGLPGDEFEYEDMNTRGPDHSQEDPFDFMIPEQAAQAESIEATEQLFSQWDEDRDRRRRGL